MNMSMKLREFKRLLIEEDMRLYLAFECDSEADKTAVLHERNRIATALNLIEDFGGAA